MLNPILILSMVGILFVLIGIYMIKRNKIKDSVMEMEDGDWFIDQEEHPIHAEPKLTDSFANKGNPFCVYCQYEMRVVDHIDLPVVGAVSKRVILSCPNCGAVVVHYIIPNFTQTGGSSNSLTLWSRKDKQDEFRERTKGINPLNFMGPTTVGLT